MTHQNILHMDSHLIYRNSGHGSKPPEKLGICIYGTTNTFLIVFFTISLQQTIANPLNMLNWKYIDDICNTIHSFENYVTVCVDIMSMFFFVEYIVYSITISYYSYEHLML